MYYIRIQDKQVQGQARDREKERVKAAHFHECNSLSELTRVMYRSRNATSFRPNPITFPASTNPRSISTKNNNSHEMLS